MISDYGPAVLPNGLLADWYKRALRGKHARVDYPVAHCRKDHQNWRCDTVKALDALEAAEALIEDRDSTLSRVRPLLGAAILIGGERYVRAEYIREALEGDSDE